ncbi:TPA: DNA mismatch repair protein MutH, partial [Mannheimia haemolytica]|nr:DNA mismatch repair protein MutH [Mannheimia haemolytica]
MQLSTFSPTEQALLSKAEWLAGFTLGEIAEMLHIPIPADL